MQQRWFRETLASRTAECLPALVTYWPAMRFALPVHPLAVVHPHPEPAANRTSTGKRTCRSSADAAKPTGKVVDSRTYENRYVPEVVKIARTYTGTPYRIGRQYNQWH